MVVVQPSTRSDCDSTALSRSDAGDVDAGLERESRDRGAAGRDQGPRALGRSGSLKPEAGRAAEVACGRLN